MLVCAPADLDKVGTDHLYLITGDSQAGHLLGQLWRAAKAAGGETAVTGRGSPPTFVETQWRAAQLASALTAESASTSGLERQIWRFASNARECDS